MKRIITLLFIVTASFSNAQAFKGKGDVKFQMGLNAQDRATGLSASTDFGIGENMSIGFVGTYLTKFDEIPTLGEPIFADRTDIKIRFNANIGNVFKLNPKMDIYPGLSLGTRNLGGHLGFRYFFTNGFGVYTELGTPLGRYDIKAKGYDLYNNQFTFNIGASFNL